MQDTNLIKYFHYIIISIDSTPLPFNTIKGTYEKPEDKDVRLNGTLF